MECQLLSAVLAHKNTKDQHQRNLNIYIIIYLQATKVNYLIINYYKNNLYLVNKRYSTQKSIMKRCCFGILYTFWLSFECENHPIANCHDLCREIVVFHFVN